MHRLSSPTKRKQVPGQLGPYGIYNFMSYLIVYFSFMYCWLNLLFYCVEYNLEPSQGTSSNTSSLSGIIHLDDRRQRRRQDLPTSINGCLYYYFFSFIYYIN